MISRRLVLIVAASAAFSTKAALADNWISGRLDSARALVSLPVIQGLFVVEGQAFVATLPPAMRGPVATALAQSQGPLTELAAYGVALDFSQSETVAMTTWLQGRTVADVQGAVGQVPAEITNLINRLSTIAAQAFVGIAKSIGK